MNTRLHFADCFGWVTGSWGDCDCDLPLWRIRKEPAELFPWRIWRRTDSFSYEHVMRCSSWEGALELVTQFMWLSKNAMVRESLDG